MWSTGLQSISTSNDEHDLWLRHAQAVIRSPNTSSRLRMAYRDRSRLLGLEDVLERDILISDIQDALKQHQRRLVQLYLILCAMLEQRREQMRHTDTRGMREFLAGLCSALGATELRQMSPTDVAQTTALFRELLRMSGVPSTMDGSVNPEYTARENIQLCASVLGVACPHDLIIVIEDIRQALVGFQTFDGTMVEGVSLGESISQILDRLCLDRSDFCQGISDTDLNNISGSRVHELKSHQRCIYDEIPHLKKPGNAKLLFLAYSNILPEHEQEKVTEWLVSEAGLALYEQLVLDFRQRQSGAQLALVLTAIVICWRLNPDLRDRDENPISDSFFTDTKELLQGLPVANSDRIFQKLIFAMIERLRCDPLANHHLITFLTSSLNLDYDAAEPVDSLIQGYVEMRMGSWCLQELPHSLALVVLGIGSPEPMWKPGSCATVVPWRSSSLLCAAHLSISSAGLTNFHPDYCQFTWVDDIAVSQDRSLLDLLAFEEAQQHVLNVEYCGDGAFELCVFKSAAVCVQRHLLTAIPTANITFDRDILKNPSKDAPQMIDGEATGDFQDLFIMRATRVVERSRMVAPSNLIQLAARFYAYQLELLFDSALFPTYWGFLGDFSDACCLVQACIDGLMSHSWRGPRWRASASAGNIFVWKENTASDHCWNDGIGWETRSADGFEVAKTLSGCGMWRKKARISIQGDVYHVVGYYRAVDAGGLSRPSASFARFVDTAS